MPANHFLGTPAENAFGGPVPRPEMAFDIERKNHISRIVDNTFQLLQMPVTVAGNIGFGGQRSVQHEDFTQRRHGGIRAVHVTAGLLADQWCEQVEEQTVFQ